MMVLCVLTLLATGCSQGAPANTTNVSAAQTKDIMDQRRDDPGFVVLDIRTPQEFRAGHVPGAVNVDYYGPNFKPLLDRLEKSATYLIYCRSGSRSASALSILDELGFQHILHLEHGFLEWQQQGLPTTRD